MTAEPTAGWPTLAELERRREAALGDGRRRSGSRGTTRRGRLTARERLDALIDAGSWYELGLLAEPEHRRDAAGAGRRDRRRPRAHRRPQGVRARGRRDRARRHDRPGQHAQAEPARALGRASAGCRSICLSDNDGGRIPDVMGWRFSGLPVRLPARSCRRPPGWPEVPRLIAVARRELRRLGAARRDGPLRRDDDGRGDRALRAAGDRGRDRRGADRRRARRPEASRRARAATPTSSSTTSRRRSAALRRVALVPARLGRAARAGRGRRRARARRRASCSTLVPRDPRRGYDMRKVLEAIFDAGSLLPWGERYGAQRALRARRASRARRSASSPASRCSAPA